MTIAAARPTSTHLTLRERAAREWYVTKVDLLIQDVPAGFRKAIRRELRSDLSAAASDVGMPRALDDLGPAAVLAEQYKLAEGRPLPHWWTGVIVFVIVAYSWAGTLAASANALADAAGQLAGSRTVTVHSVWLGSTVSVTHGGQLAAELQFSMVTAAVLLLVPLVAARAWRYRPAWLQRLRTRRAARTAAPPAPAGQTQKL